jgi:hypothetical protein
MMNEGILSKDSIDVLMTKTALIVLGSLVDGKRLEKLS